MLSIATAGSLAFNAAPVVQRPVVRAPAVSMAVEDLVGGINDPIFGGTPEGKIFDPLGLGADEGSLYRRRCVEIKHGRICMVAFLGMTVGPNDLIAPSHALLAPSLDLHFDDIPGGIQGAFAVPSAGWAQIVALVGLHELTVAKQVRARRPHHPSRAYRRIQVGQRPPAPAVPLGVCPGAWDSRRMRTMHTHEGRTGCALGGCADRKSVNHRSHSC
jgi:hypothetical protein